MIKEILEAKSIRKVLLKEIYQPKTGAKCSCKPGVQRDNCPNCEGTGEVIDFQAIRSRHSEPETSGHYVEVNGKRVWEGSDYEEAKRIYNEYCDQSETTDVFLVDEGESDPVLSRYGLDPSRM